MSFLTAVTRPQPDADAFVSLLAAHGVDAFACPVMEISACKEEIDLSEIGAVAFTSANGVRAFAANRPDAADLPAFAVGPVTAKAAVAAGFRRLETASGDMASLAALICARGADNAPVLHVAGTHRAGDLVALLAENGVKARRVVLYEALAINALTDRQVAQLKTARCVAFFSPRTVRLFGKMLQRHRLGGLKRTLVAACLSASVARVARDLGFGLAIVADAPDAAALAEAIDDRAQTGS